MLQAQLDQMVKACLVAQPRLSDIIAAPGGPVQTLVHGALMAVGSEGLTPSETEAMAGCLMGEDERLAGDLGERGSCDLSYALAGLARFRVNIFRTMGALGLVMRRLPSKVPSLKALNLPRVFEDLAEDRQGLVLVTGATGSGKSTTLAALVDRINERRAVHVVTLEDPVEFLHSNKKATINHRELGLDFDSFASGLRAALRQAPQVVLVGEIRDRETLEMAMQAGETGHLVLGTLHTADAGQTIARILGMFEPSEERLVRMRLASSLSAVISQRLIRRLGGGRVAAFEILRSSLRSRELILKGESRNKTFLAVMEEGEVMGMVSFDQSVAALYRQGLIDEEQALFAASDRAALGKLLDGIKTSRGERVTSIQGLEIDKEYHYGRHAGVNGTEKGGED